ncbi:MAG: carbohydrate porin [Opitutae bacterium]
MEAGVGVVGGTENRQAIHGLGLVQADWQPVAPVTAGLQYTGCLSALALSGEGPSGRFLGDYLAASNLEGYESVRLYSWWLEASRNDWSLRAGALLADEEFAGTEAGGNFFNSAFGWPSFISANTVNTGPAFYVAALGLRLEHRWGDTAAWRFGLYDGDTFDSPTGDPTRHPHGLHFELGGEQGWFLITEASYSPAGHATRYKVGTWFHTATFEDVRDDAAGNPSAISGQAPRQHGENYGAYASLEHTFAGKSGQAGQVKFFVRGGIAPANRNAIGWAVDTGLGWTGPIPGRPADVLSLGLTHAEFSPHYSEGIHFADPSSPVLDFERVIELNYSVKLSDHISLQPDLQFISHPGGTAARHDALVFLFRLKSSY